MYLTEIWCVLNSCMPCPLNMLMHTWQGFRAPERLSVCFSFSSPESHYLLESCQSLC